MPAADLTPGTPEWIARREALRASLPGIGGGGLSWKDDWASGTTYKKGDVVYYKGGAWYAPGDIVADLAPGMTSLFATIACPSLGGRLTTGYPCNWIGPDAVPFSAGSGDSQAAFYYFDVTAAGKITVDMTAAAGEGYAELYDPAAVVSAPGPAQDIVDRSVTVKRYYLAVSQWSGGHNNVGTVRVIPGSAPAATMTLPAATALWERLSPGRVEQAYTVQPGYTADRAFNPESAAVQEVARVLGTLIDDLRVAGLIQ